MVIPEKLLAAFDKRNIDLLAHSGRVFKDHLIGVHNILYQWKMPRHICYAGLFHSVYGTSDFPKPLFAETQRHELSDLIGERAERLAFLFSKLRPNDYINIGERPTDSCFVSVLQKWSINCSTQDAKDIRRNLVIIYWANIIEQFDHLPEGHVSKPALIEIFAYSRSYLPQNVALSVKKYLQIND